MEIYLYLALNILTLSVPLLRSFEPKIKFFSKWKSFILANIPVSIGFLIWDEYFTQMGVWGFNPDYLTGLYIGSLPIEECLFFLTIPYATVFVYEVLNYFVKWELPKYINQALALIIGLLNIGLALMNFEKAYTATSLLINGLLLLTLAFFLPKLLKGLFRTYLVVLPGFFLVNGVLTGSFIASPIVWYNNAENLGIRMGTIPVEDAFYGMTLLFLNLVLYKLLRSPLYAQKG